MKVLIQYAASRRRTRIRRSQTFVSALGLLSFFVLLPALPAQDTRNVTEPVIPRACVVLTAQLPEHLSTADEAKPDTARMQDALDHCPAGQAVELKSEGANRAFLSGPVQLRKGVTLLIDANTTLYASRNPRDYDITPGKCGTVDKTGHGCKPLIAIDHVSGAAIMGDGTIDGRGSAPLIGRKESWWDLAQDAKAKQENQNCPRLIVANRADDFTLYRITLKNSPNFHVSYRNGNGFTAWGVIIKTPRTARNTDGIDPGPATNVTITHCFIDTGDDNVAIKAGGKCSHMSIAHNHFYAGHGVSIGSETNGGADTIRVTDLSIDGADNGIRIKSNSGKGGKVTDIVYEDVCIKNTKYPIYMDTDYAHFGKQGNLVPWFTGITLKNVHILTGGRIMLQGFDAQHPLGMTFDNVWFDSLPDTKVTAEHAALNFASTNLRVAGETVTITGTPTQAPPNACSGKFVPMP
jgi:polygalacturonase